VLSFKGSLLGMKAILVQTGQSYCVLSLIEVDCTCS